MTTPAQRTAILDTIDNAISDYELSADAMRWTPEAPAPATGGHVAAGPRIAAFAESCGFALDAWQRSILDSGLTVRIDATAELMRRSVDHAIKGLSFAFQPLIDEVRWGKPRRTERVARMRRAYRAKRGRRW